MFCPGRSSALRPRISSHRGIGAQDDAIQIGHGHADGSIFEGRTESFVGLSQRLVGVLAIGDVMEVRHQPPHIGISEVIRHRGFEPPPRPIGMLQAQLGSPADVRIVAGSPDGVSLILAKSSGCINSNAGRAPKSSRDLPSTRSNAGLTYCSWPSFVDHDDDVGGVSHQCFEPSGRVPKVRLDTLTSRGGTTE